MSSGPPANPASPASTLIGRYDVTRTLGRGAFGEVVAVRDRQSRMEYALKRVPPDLARDPNEMENVRSNYWLVSRLTHPHIATTRFLETDPQSGAVYILMDLVDGPTFGTWLHEARKKHGGPNSPLPMPLVLGIAEQIATALDYAHGQQVVGPDGSKSQGILHRDLKPGNVMLDRHQGEFRPGVPFVRLVDFGLAAQIQASIASVSAAGTNASSGTPAYMSPEQYEGRTLTRGADQWALAVMMYEMLAGRRPYEGPMTSIYAQIMNRPPAPVGHLSNGQWAALSKALSKDRRSRYPSCTTFVKSLADAEPETEGTVVSTPPMLPPEDLGSGNSTGQRDAPSTHRGTTRRTSSQLRTVPDAPQTAREPQPGDRDRSIGWMLAGCGVLMLLTLAAGGVAAAILIPQMTRPQTTINADFAIGACRTLVNAEEAYYRTDHDKDGVPEYAQTVAGLYRMPDGTILGLIDAEIAAADADLAKPIPYHGYFFKVLKRARNPDKEYIPAPVGKGPPTHDMTAGYAFLAWPAEYGVSGRMTFLVGTNGDVRHRDLGPDTVNVAAKIDAYDRGGWTRAKE